MLSNDRLAESPEAGGIDAARFEALCARAARAVEEAGLPAAQLAVARNGRIAAQRNFGAANDDTLFVVFSCSKAITSSAGWMLLEAGQMRLDDRVADHLPGFGANGKESVTVEQLFTHTAGFPTAPLDPRGFAWTSLPSAFSKWRLNWEPGSRFEYHPSSSMWVIAALVQQLSGIEFRDFVRSRIAEPLGLPDLCMGCPPEQQHRVADVTHVGRARTNEELIAEGFPPKPLTEVTEENLQRFNDAGVRSVGVPGGGVTAGAADLALFYQALVAGGAGLWKPETIADARRIRNRAFLDPMFLQPANRGLGIVTGGGREKAYFGFGRIASDATFGHGGAGGQIAWADPESGLSFCFLTSGHDRNLLREARRTTALSSLAGACVPA